MSSPSVSSRASGATVSRPTRTQDRPVAGHRDQHDSDVRYRTVRHDPVMVATFGGPQAMFGWIIGALVALADGLIWAELGAAMPGAGGTYIYLREAFQYRTGRLCRSCSCGAPCFSSR